MGDQIDDDSVTDDFNAGGKKRISFWSSVIKRISDDTSARNDFTAQLPQLIVATLPLYHDRESQRAVTAALRVALRNEAFVRAFAALLVRIDPATASRGECQVISAWICLLIAALDAPSAKKAVTKLAERQGAALTGLLGSKRRWAGASHRVHCLIRRRPELLEDYMEVATSSGSPGAVRMLLDYCAAEPQYMQSRRAAFLQLYIDKVLGARDPVPTETLSAYQPLLQVLTKEEFAGTLLPTAIRMMKRAPESVLNSVAHLFSHVGLDSNAEIQQITADLLPLLRHVRDSVRIGASEVLKAAALRVTDLEALRVAVRSLQNVLDGTTGGKIKVATERLGLVSGITAFASAPAIAYKGNPEAPAFASDVASFLSTFYKEENNEEVKAALIAAIGTWLPHVDVLPQDVLTRLSEGLKEKESLRKGHLRAIISAVQGNPTLVRQAADLAPGLAKVLADGVAKPAQRAESILALLPLAHMSAVSSIAASSQMWEVVSKDDSVIFATATTAKLLPDEAVCAVQLLHVLFAKHRAKLKAAVPAAARQLVLFMLHPSAQVRRAASEATDRLLGTDPEIAETLVEALGYWLAHPRSLPSPAALPAGAKAAAAGGEAGDPAVPSDTRLSEWFQAALLAVTPHNARALSPVLAARLLLAAQHPVILQPRSRSRGPWHAVRRKALAFASALEQDSEAVVRTLMGPEGVCAPGFPERAAGYAALGAAVDVAPDALRWPLLTTLAAMLDRSQHDALSPSDVRVFQTPEGQVALEVDISTLGTMSAPKQATVLPPPAKPSQATAAASRKGAAKSQPVANGVTRPSAGGPARGGTAGPGPAGRAADAGSKSAKDPAKLQRDVQLAKEAEVRRRVVEIRDKLAQGLEALAGVANGNPVFTGDHLQELAGLVTPLMASPLVGEGACFEAARALASSLPDPLDRQSLAVACALHVVAQGPGSNVEVPMHWAVRDTVAALASATAGGRPLSPQAYAFCFPVLRAVLSWRHHTPVHDQALGVLALRVSPAVPIPRADTLELLFHVLSIMPAYRASVGPLIGELCSGLSKEEVGQALKGLLAASPIVRAAALDALPNVPCLAEADCPREEEVIAPLWLARFDPDQDNAELADGVWEYCEAQLGPAFVLPLARLLSSPHLDIRRAAASALPAGIQEHPEKEEEALEAIVRDYAAGNPGARTGRALALKACASCWSGPRVQAALDFLLSRGLADADDGVRNHMVEAGVELLNAHGREGAQLMLPLLEGYLEKRKVEVDEETYDRVRTGAVVFLGTLARHLPPSDPKVRSILGTLMDVLTTPSGEVQRAVSDCLSPLMPAVSGDRAYVESLIRLLLQRLTKGSSYGDRRGAAYGLAGMVKGLGISSLNGYGILSYLTTALDDKDPSTRQGGLFGVECLCEKLGRLFEPYVVKIMGRLLERFGDGNAAVREANDSVSRVVMAHLSSQGVKLVMPALLEGVESKAWRAKQGAVQMLGAMAYCAPAQLSTALPLVVPKLGEVLSDPHPKVQAAAQQALQEVGSVIRNPEVQTLVPTLLAAISNPNAATRTALDVLLSTTFVNTVDTASLALIIPVVQRGLRDRSGDVKKRAARIVGNMCSLINEPKDMAPYVAVLEPELRAALADPLPEVRATAAKALGSLLRGMGPSHFQNLLPWLLDRLKSEGSTVERSGAAQGLAEVLAVLGPAQLEVLLPTILANCSARNAYTREGTLTLFKFLPTALPQLFQDHLGSVLPAILNGLADESEGVRDAALAAGRTLVELYALTALPLLLPAVEHGIINDNWRIRQSSVELLGDLLFKVAGTSGRVRLDGGDDEEGPSTEEHSAAILQALGLERRNQVLARVYMARSDVGYSVRTAAMHVWKTVVTNTPRTLSEILPCLMDQIIASLASSGEERQQMAGRCLGELVRKMGGRVIHQIMPIMSAGIQSDAPETRQGVCWGLREVLANVTREQLTEHIADIIPTVQAALVDPDTGVRQAAGSAMGVLFKTGGGTGVEGVLPSLLAGIDGDARQFNAAVEGLRVLLSVRIQTLNALVPKLLRPPLRTPAVRALGAVAQVASPAIHNQLGSIVPPLLAAIDGEEPELSHAAADALDKVAAAVPEDGLYLLIAQLERGLEGAGRRRAAANAITTFCNTSRLPFQEHVPSLLLGLGSLLGEEDVETLQACSTALAAVISTIPKDVLGSYTSSVREAIATARDKLRRKGRQGPTTLPGLCLPKTVQAVQPVYMQSILHASPLSRQLAAEALGELLQLTSQEALRPSLATITGGLIRVVGDKFDWEVRAALLKTLGILLDLGQAAMKPFVPSLQTLFRNFLSEPARAVRQSAALNLGELARLSPRAGQLAEDLAVQAHSIVPPLQEAYLTALKGVLASAGERIASPSLSLIGQQLQAIASSAGEDEATLSAVAASMGVFSKYCSPEEVRAAVRAGGLGSAGLRGSALSSALTLAAVAQNAPARLEELGLLPKAFETVKAAARDENSAARLAAARGAGYLALAELEGQLPQGTLGPLVPVMATLLSSEQPSEVQRCMMTVLRKLAVTNVEALEEAYSMLVPALCAILQQTQGPTKLAAERTLARILEADAGTDRAAAFLASKTAGPVAKTYLTDSYLRRLGRLPLDEDDARSEFD